VRLRVAEVREGGRLVRRGLEGRVVVVLVVLVLVLVRRRRRRRRVVGVRGGGVVAWGCGADGGRFEICGA
jgi:hypothetical protein